MIKKKKHIHPNPPKSPIVITIYSLPLNLRHNRDSAVKSGAEHYVCIFIQLSYLSEQIIRGDKLKR